MREACDGIAGRLEKGWFPFSIPESCLEEKVYN